MVARLTLGSGQQEVVRWTAIVTMVVDHVGAVLLEPSAALPLRAVGRVAWPLFAFLLAYNVARRGVDPVRYLRPLALWYALSVLPYALAFGTFRPNILATLFLAAGALALLTRSGQLSGWRQALAALGLLAVLLASVRVEYGTPGVLLPVCTWWALARPTAGAALLTVALVAAQNHPWVVWPAALLALPVPFVAARLAFGLPRSGRLAWAFYPAHLLLLGGVAHLLGRG